MPQFSKTLAASPTDPTPRILAHGFSSGPCNPESKGFFLIQAIDTPWKINLLNSKVMEVDGSDDFPFRSDDFQAPMLIC